MDTNVSIHCLFKYIHTYISKLYFVPDRIDFFFLILACHAVAIVSSSTMIFIPVKFIYNMLKTSQGILFAGVKSGMVGAYMTLPETSSSIAKLSFTLKIAKEVNVTFWDRNNLLIKKVSIIYKHTTKKDNDVKLCKFMSFSFRFN